MSAQWLGWWMLGIETLIALSLLGIVVELGRLRRTLDRLLPSAPGASGWLGALPEDFPPGTLHMPEGWFERRVAEQATLRPPPPSTSS